MCSLSLNPLTVFSGGPFFPGEETGPWRWDTLLKVTQVAKRSQSWNLVPGSQSHLVPTMSPSRQVSVQGNSLTQWKDPRPLCLEFRG